VTFVIWLTGIPASGKSSIAKKLREKLIDMDWKVEVLESDELRRVLTPKPLYTDEERDWFYSTIIWLAQLLHKHDINVIIDATGHKKKYRDEARKIFGKNFIEVYVKCSVETAMKRDPKGLYRRALTGEVRTLPGLQVPYEETPNPEITLDTEKLSIDECVEEILKYLMKRIRK